MRVGLIGAGNMASALLGGMLSGGMVTPSEVILSDPDSQKLSLWKEKGITVTDNNRLVEEKSEILFFAVKPAKMKEVLSQMEGDPHKIYISIAAGVTLFFLERILGADKKIVRTMPNTPAQIGCGMTVMTPNQNLTAEEEKTVAALLESVGSVLSLSERDLEIATAIHGSSPAYVYMMIEAMADAGVRHGLTKDTALQLAAKAVEGSAKMVLSTQEHPMVLKDKVCSPGGTTIAAVCTLEEKGFSHALHAAVDACIKRNFEMQQ